MERAASSDALLDELLVPLGPPLAKKFPRHHRNLILEQVDGADDCLFVSCLSVPADLAYCNQL